MIKLNESEPERQRKQVLQEQWKKIFSLDTKLVNILQRIKLETLRVEII